ncbi:hypothetical protein JCM10908_001200 [Rhodotorula pacifica]|uniref:uncharacterized protein n=1 Tax=Rhodotorula pacifica TaxID=1495444 RepID=UPI00317BB56B
MASLRTELAADDADGKVLAAPQMSATHSSENRSVSHGRRTQSLSEGHHHSSAAPSSSAAGAVAGSGSGPAGVGAAAQMGGEGALGSAATAAGEVTASGAAGLTRRNNTVSTASSSRLVRLERNRARLALQGVGLSEEDQEFYVPPSPVHGGPYAIWSDVGHGNSTPANASAAVNAQAAWSRIQEEEQYSQLPDQPSPSTAANIPAQASISRVVPPSEPKRSSFVVVRGGKGDAALTERRARERIASAPGGDSALYPSPIGSVFQTSPQQQVSSPPPNADQPLRHKNSLKPFLEQERAQQGGAEVEEDWEKGLLAERRSGAEGPALDADSRRTPERNIQEGTPPPLSGTFPSQLASPYALSGSTSPRAAQPQRGQTIDPWLPPVSANPAISTFGQAADEPLRRHQSLKSFRAPRHREASIEQTLSSSPASAGGWPEHIAAVGAEDDFQAAAAGQPARQMGSHLTVANANNIGGFASRTRSGTSPAPLALQHSNSLGHSSSSSAFADSLGPVRLSHSNSLSAAYPSSSSSGSTTLHHSNSLGSRSDSGTTTGGGGETRTRVLSPVVSAFGGAKSPWSLTEAETQQLGLNSSYGSGSAESGGISRDSSGSSHGSRAGPAQSAQQLSHEALAQNAHAAEVRRLEDALGAMQVGNFAPPTASFTQFERNSPSPGAGSGARRLAPLMTSAEALSMNGSSMAGLLGRHGPASAAAFVPPIGHSHAHFAPHTLDGISEYSVSTASSSPPMPQQQQFQSASTSFASAMPAIAPATPGGFAGGYEAPTAARNHLTAVPGSINAADWTRQKEFLLGGATPTAGNVPTGVPYPAASLPMQMSSDPQIATIQQLQMQQQQQQIASLQNQMAQALSAMDAMRAQGAVLPANFDLANAARLSGPSGLPQSQGGSQAQQQQVPETPVDVNSLAQTKGYNPAVFDLNPPQARFFVIKSYTEEDVHKSLKYEIWASTDLGNKRLDRAFRESADKGPIYLFFSVNASGHFAGVAQMQTPVDYSMSSNVWASDKWKGVLKVRWIYIKDVPLSALRHIRLSNTPENKPVTSSRDTQEVPYEAGLEVLRIIANYQSRTSLLQDYAWYEAQFRRNQQHAQAGAGVDAQVQPGEPIPPQPAPHYGNTTSPSPGPPQDATHKAPRQQQQAGQAQGQQGGRRFWNRGAGGGPMANPASAQQNGMSRNSPGLPQAQQQPYGQAQYQPYQHPGLPPMPSGPPPQGYYPGHLPQHHQQQQHNGGPY